MSETYFACADHTQKVETHFSTCALGDEGWGTQTSPGENHTVFTSVKPPEGYVLGSDGKGMIQNGIISGQKVINEREPTYKGDFYEKITMSWYFTKAGPLSMQHCESMFWNELEEEVKTAFSEPDHIANFEEVNLDGIIDCYKKIFISIYTRDSLIPMPIVPFRVCIREKSSYDPKGITQTREKMLELEIKAAIEDYYSRLIECKKIYLGCLECEEKK